MGADWPIQQIARLAGTTSRTLRHYDEIGLLTPARIGQNGYRYYDRDSLVRLQRILLLRDLGLGLPAIADVVNAEADAPFALRRHLAWLQQEQARLARQAVTLELTITALEEGGELMAADMLDGFDHTEYKEEVEERWGADAYAKSDAWWRGLSATQKQEFQARQKRLAQDWISASGRGVGPESAEAQALAQRQFDWLSGVLGTSAQTYGPTKEYFVGLGDMYVADPRFAANYGGQTGAEFVRRAMRVYAERNL